MTRVDDPRADLRDQPYFRIDLCCEIIDNRGWLIADEKTSDSDTEQRATMLGDAPA